MAKKKTGPQKTVPKKKKVAKPGWKTLKFDGCSVHFAGKPSPYPLSVMFTISPVANFTAATSGIQFLWT